MARVPEDKVYQGMVDGEYWDEEVIEYGVDGVVHKMDVPEMEVLEDGGRDVASTAKVEVKDGSHGLRLYALEFIRRNRIIRKYSGELITEDEPDRREKARDADGMKRDHMMSVEGAVIDATYVGGPCRYANHSCDPNVVFDLKTFESGGVVVVLRATRDIQKGEPIEADYKFVDMNWYKKCDCRSRNCRKWDVMVL